MVRLNFFSLSAVILWQTLLCAGDMPSDSILGFGTQKINEENVALIQNAIDLGYRLFDMAESYGNTDIIASEFAKSERENLYIVYKIWLIYEN